MMRSIALASCFVLACGGSKPVPTSVEGGPQNAPPTATGTTSTAAPEPTRLAIGEMKIIMTHGAKRMEIVVAADGTVSAAGGEVSKHDLRLTAYGELEVDGQAAAKLADDGTLTVRHDTIEKVEGKVVKSESKWNTIGILEADGTFTAAKDNRKITIAHDGKISLPGMDIAIEAAPAHRRAGMFLVIGMMAGGKSVSDTKASTSAPVAPVPPMKP